MVVRRRKKPVKRKPTKRVPMSGNLIIESDGNADIRISFYPNSCNNSVGRLGLNVRITHDQLMELKKQKEATRVIANCICVYTEVGNEMLAIMEEVSE